MSDFKIAWPSEDETQKGKPQDAKSKNGSGNSNPPRDEAPADFVLGYPENESFPEDESNLDLEPEESETKNNLDETPQKGENKDQENKVNEDGDLKQKIAKLKSIFDEIVPSETAEYTMRYEDSKNLGTYKKLPLKKHNENKFVLGSEFSLRYELSDGKVTKIDKEGIKTVIKNSEDVDKIITKVSESLAKDRQRLQDLAKAEKAQKEKRDQEAKSKADQEARARKDLEKSQKESSDKAAKDNRELEEKSAELKKIFDEIIPQSSGKYTLQYKIQKPNGSELTGKWDFDRSKNKFTVTGKKNTEYSFSGTKVLIGEGPASIEDLNHYIKTFGEALQGNKDIIFGKIYKNLLEENKLKEEVAGDNNGSQKRHTYALEGGKELVFTGGKFDNLGGDKNPNLSTIIEIKNSLESLKKETVQQGKANLEEKAIIKYAASEEELKKSKLLDEINKSFVEILEGNGSVTTSNGTITKSEIFSKEGTGIKEGEAWNGEQFTYTPKDGDQSKKIVFSNIEGVSYLGEIPENNHPDASLSEILQALDDLEKIKKEQKEKKDSEIIKKLNDTREEGGQKRSENVRRLKEILEEIAPNIGEEYRLKYRDQNGEEKNRKFVREGEEKFVSENENIMTYEFSNDDVEKEEGSFEMRLLGILSGFKIKDYKDISKEDLGSEDLDQFNAFESEEKWLEAKKGSEERLNRLKKSLKEMISSKTRTISNEEADEEDLNEVFENLLATILTFASDASDENHPLLDNSYNDVKDLINEDDLDAEESALRKVTEKEFTDKLVAFLKKGGGLYTYSNAMGDEDLFFTTEKLEAALESSKTTLLKEIKDNFSEILQYRDEVATKNGTITKSKIVLGKEEAEQFVYTAKTADGKAGQPQKFLFSGDLLFLGDEEDPKPKLSTIRQAANDLAKFKQDLENESAIKIQSNFRGYNVRNDIKSEVTKTKSIENRDLQDLDESKKTAAQQQKVKTNGRINSEKAKEFKASVSETSGEVEDLESEIPEVKKEDVQTPAFPNDAKIENELAAKVASKAITLRSAFAGAAISVAKKRELDEKAETKPLVPAIVSENPAWSSTETIAFIEGEEEKGEKKKGGEEAEEGKEDRDGKTPAFTVVERKTLSAVAAAERPIVVNVISEEIPKTIEEGEREKEENKKEGEEKREKKNKTIAPLLDTGVPESIFSFASKLQMETTEKDKKSLNDQGSTPERKKDLEQTKKMLEDFFEKRISEINRNDTKNYTNDNKELLNTNKVMRVLAKISQALEVLPQEEDQNWAQNKIKEMISKDGKNSFKDSLPKGLILTDGDKSVLAMMCLKDDDRRTVFGNSGGPRFNPQRINEDLANKIAETSLKLAQALQKEDLENFKFSQTKDRLPSELSKELRGKTLNLDSAPSNSVENPKALKLSLKAYEVRGV